MSSLVLYGNEFDGHLNNGLTPQFFKYRILAEGDSWMDRSAMFHTSLLQKLAPKMDAAGDDVLIINLSRFGDTMRRMGGCADGEFRLWIDTAFAWKFDAILLSAGGNAIKCTGGKLNSEPAPSELPRVVRPGEALDLSVSLVAPTVSGVYRSEWKLFVDGGTLTGVGANGQTPLYAQVVVGTTGGGTQIAPYTYFAELKHVILALDAPIYMGVPGDVSHQVNLMAAGQTLLVTGISTDSSWWRVLCVGDIVGPCWITTNPAVAQKSYLAPGTPIAPNAVETGVRYVYANADVPVFGGEPGATSTILPTAIFSFTLPRKILKATTPGWIARIARAKPKLRLRHDKVPDSWIAQRICFRHTEAITDEKILEGFLRTNLGSQLRL